MMYDEQKAAQAAAYLLHRAPGARLPLIKLLKLMYLAERLSFARYGVPLTGDRLVSLNNGPVLSMTLNHMNGSERSCEEGWESWIADRENHMLSLRDESMIRTPEQDLLALSDSDLEVLGEVWEEFGHYQRWDLVDYTHTLPEWQDPHGSSLPISYDELFRAVGFEQEAADQLETSLTQQRRLARQFA